MNMKKLIGRVALFSVLLASFHSIYAVSESCKPIVKACIQAGYYKNGKNVGKGLVVDCLKPVTSGKKVLHNTNFSNEILSQCKAKLLEKMQNRKKATQSL